MSAMEDEVGEFDALCGLGLGLRQLGLGLGGRDHEPEGLTILAHPSARGKLEADGLPSWHTGTLREARQ